MIKGVLVLLLVGLLSVAALFCMVYSASAESSPLAPEGYFDFSSPTSVFANADGIHVTENKDAVFSFESSGKYKGKTNALGAKKALKSGNDFVFMTDTAINYENVSITISATDISCFGNNFYATDGNSLYSFSLDGKLNTLSSGYNIKSVAASEGCAYFISESTAGVYSVFKHSDIGTELIKKLNGEAKNLTCLSENEICFNIGNKIYVYDIAADFTVKSATTSSDIIDISAHNKLIYLLTAQKEVLSYDKSIKILITSKSTEKGYYNSPTSIASRKNLICAVDSENNRIAVIENDKITGYIPADSPSDVDIDYNGNIYVSSSYSVKVYGKNLDPIITDNTYSITGSRDNIVSIAIDYSQPFNNTIYAVTDEGALENITSGSVSPSSEFKKVRMSPGGELFALTKAESIVKIVKSTLGIDTAVTPLSVPTAVDFTIDAVGNIFATISGSITKYSKSGSAYAALETSAISGQPHGVAVSMVATGLFNFGDIIATDSLKNRIIKIDGMSADMRKTDANYLDGFKNGTGQSESSESIIRSMLLGNTDIYENPIEMPAICTLSAGTQVIVLDSQTYNADGYWLVLVDLKHGEGVYGFVNKELLSEAKAYTKNYSTDKCIFLSESPIYKYPSIHSKNIRTVKNDDIYNILPFVNGYTDAYDNEWCRISLDGGLEGYILRGSVSIGGNVSIHDKNLPKYNAYIKAVKDETTVNTYDDGEGKIVSAFSIAVKKEIEVVGAFNLSKDYTLVKYVIVDGNSRTMVRTCYVPTANIYYAETTIYQIIAFSVIALIIILTAALIFVKIKRDNNIANK